MIRHLPFRKWPTELSILEKNKAFIVLYKPKGITTEINPWEYSAEQYVLDYCGLSLEKDKRKVWVVHRLDKPTSGLLVFAFKKSVITYLQEIWASQVEKTYLAYVVSDSAPTVGVYKAYHSRNATGKKAIVASYNMEGSKAISTEILSVESKGDYHALTIALHTGKYHQIRAHLSFLGFPVVGDTFYGGLESEHFGLCAYELSFPWKNQTLRFRVP